MLKTLKIVKNNIKHCLYIKKVLNDKEYKKESIMAEIIRYTHSIEKGLSLSEPRAGFGYKKIIVLFSLINEYISLSQEGPYTCIYMALDAIHEYLEWHKKIQYSDIHIEEIEREYQRINSDKFYHTGKYGGTIRITTGENRDTFEELVKSRHSIRDFENEEVNIENVRKAINIAKHCPSACNRQCTRVHIISRKQKDILAAWLQGTGGFQEKIDKFLLITGKVTCYREEELYQYIVSASIFAGYLTLALEDQNIGACVIQRPVIRNKEWELIQRKLSIPLDEQAILIIGIGKEKKECKVPVSYRLPYDELVTEHF